MKFEEAIKLNNLGDRIEEQYGKWGHFTEENAKTVVLIAKGEAIGHQSRLPSLMAMTAFTWCNESTWMLNPGPNTNNKPQNPWNWDIGPFQLNVQWTMRMSWQQDFTSRDLPWKKVFGESFYLEDGTTPAPFNGDPIFNGRCALRRTLLDNRNPGAFGFPDRETMQVVLYTGPKAQPSRLKSWNKYGEDFKKFFEAYTAKES